MRLLRYTLALAFALTVLLPFSLLAALIAWFNGHLLRTVFYTLPVQTRVRTVFGAWLAHSFAGKCWKCGASPATLSELLGRRPL